MIHEAALRDSALPASRGRGGLPTAEDRDVEAMVDRALGWVVSQLDEFDPFLGGRPFEIRHAQKLAELATMLHGYVGLTGDGDSPEVRRILDLVRSTQKSRELCDRILRAPAEFVLYCILYGVMRARGEDDLAQREILQRAVDAGLLEQSERVVHRQMDVSLHLEWGGFRHDWPSLEELCADSILGQHPRPLFLDENALYAITHVVMFLYGFGLRPAGASLETVEVRDMLSSLLVVSCQERHWDLLAELLLCWDCIAFAPTPVYERAWQALLAAQEEDGAMPGPESALTLGAPYFSHHYHTTLVSILAGALCLQRSGARIEARPVSVTRRPPDTVSAARRARRWLEGLLEENRRPDDLCRILLGCWLCDSILGEETSAFPETARRIAAELIILEEEGAAFDELPAALALLAEALLVPGGIAVASLQEFAAILAEVLPSGEDAALAEKRLLLHILGFGEEPEPPRGDGALELVRTLPLSATREEIEDLALRLHAWTGYGTRPVTLSPADAWIPEMLAGLATHCLRQYNFMTATRLLRAMLYLGGGGVEEHLGFLVLHQRPEGAFGFLGPEEGKLRGRADAEGFSADRDLYLPVTVNCLWALAEGAGTGWRLYGSLRSGRVASWMRSHRDSDRTQNASLDLLK